MRIADKVCIFISRYRSTNQSIEEFVAFSDNLKLNLDEVAKKQLFLIVTLVDLNAELSKCYENDSTSYEDNKIDDITSQF